MKAKIFGLILVFIVSLGIIKPLFSRGYFPMHDDTQVGRVVAMGKALRWGQLPVRWVSDLGYGYGYPIFNFYGPLPYYAGGVLYALGVPGLVATKIMMMIGMMASGVVLYLAVMPFLGVAAAIVASIFYMYAPYHAVQLYVRGAVGELWTLIFYPFLLWALLKIHGKNSSSHAALAGGIGLAGVILSHTLLGYATTIMLVAAGCFQWLLAMSQKRPFPFGDYARALFIGLSLSAFFWLPAIMEMRYTDVASQVGKTADFHDHFVCIGQLWSSLWGFGGSTPGCVDGLSFMLGKLHILFASAVTIVAFIYRKRFVYMHVFVFAAAISLMGIYLSNEASAFLWELIPSFSYLQYPWRFLGYAMFGLSVLAGVLVACLGQGVRAWVASVFIGVFALFLYGKWFTPQYLYEKPLTDFESEKTLRFDVSDISHEYLPPDFVRPTSEAQYARRTIVPGQGMTVAYIVTTDTYERFSITTNKDEAVQLNKAVFPGWKYLVNGEEQVPVVSASLPTIFIPKGLNVVEIVFTNTPIRTLGNIISLIAAFGLLFIYGKKHKKTNT